MISYCLFLSINLFSSLQEYHKVNTRLHHSAFFFARDSAFPQVWHVKLSRFTFHRSVPGCFWISPWSFPCCVNLKATLGIHASSILKTCPGHLNLHCFSSMTHFVYYFFYNKNWGLSSCYFLITATDNYTDVWWMLIKIFDSNWTPLNT